MIFVDNNDDTKEKLKKLWIKTFGDDKRYLDKFFEGSVDEIKIFIQMKANEVLAALYMVPYDIISEGKKYKVMYLYALATDEKYKEQGIMTGLMDEAYTYAKANGFDSMLLIPAEEKLFSFYKKRDYKSSYIFSKYSMKKSTFEKFAIDNNLVKEKYDKDLYRIFNNKKTGLHMSENVFGIFLYGMEIYGIDIYSSKGMYLFVEETKNEVVIHYSDFMIKDNPKHIDVFERKVNTFDISKIENLQLLLQ